MFRRVDDLQFAVEEARLSSDGSRVGTVSSAVSSDQEIIINELSAEIVRLSLEITTNEKQVSAISVERDEFRDEAERLALELGDKTSEITALTTSAIAHSSVITQLNIQLSTLQQKVDESNTTLLEYESGFADMKQQHQESLEHANSVEEEKSRLERQLSELVNRSGDSSQQLLHMDNELRNRDSTISNLEQTIRELLLKMETLMAELEGERLRAAEAEAEVTRLSSQHADHTGQLGQKEAEFEEAVFNFKAEIAKLNVEKSALETKIQMLLEDQSNFDEEKEIRYSAINKELLALKMALADSVDECEMKSNEMLSLQSTIAHLNVSLKEFKLGAAENSQKDDVTVQRLHEDNIRLAAANSEIESKLLEALAEIKTERELRATLEYERQQLADDLASVIASRDSLKLIESAMSDNISELSVLSLANHHLQAENDALSQDLEKSTLKAARVEELLTEVAKLKAEITDADLLYQNTVSNMESEKYSLLQNVSAYEVRLKDKEATLNDLFTEMDKVKAELDSIKEETAKNYVANSGLTDDLKLEGGTSRQNSEKIENPLEEIKFLNSVIVDLQSKNEALQLKLDSMLSTEYELDVLNSSMDSSEMPQTVELRLFCDICDVFDQHDTDDCPVQASFGTPPDQSLNNSSFLNDRPYCDICEVFGHWSEDCDDQQTF